MAKRKRKTKQPRIERFRWWTRRDAADKRALVFAGCRVAVAVAVGMVLGAVLGLRHLDGTVHAAPAFNEPLTIELVDVPEGLESTLNTNLAAFRDYSAYDRGVCAKIGRVLDTEPWIRRVKSVRRTRDLTVLVSCEYRLPAALVQLDAEFYLVDDDQVRLPGVYGFEPSLPLIQGVGGTPPPPGDVWPGADLAAGMTLARLIEPEAFADQITGIQVHNYAGRAAQRDAHLVLTTDRAGCRIKWGSAPGEEIEENSAVQKMAILRHNYERFGRADAGFRTIDVSVYADRFTAED